MNGQPVNCSTEERCNCTLGTTYLIADCSGLLLQKTPNFTENVTIIDLGFNRIQTFPTNLPPHVTHLNLTGNSQLKDIKKNDLNRYKQLQHLVVSYCYLSRIEKGAFERNENIEYLDISNNPKLTLSVLNNITTDLQSSKIKTLLLDKLECTYGVSVAFLSVYVEHLSNTTLETLSVASNRISYFEHKVFDVLPKTLREINVGDNDLGYGLYLYVLSNLRGVQIINATFQNSFHLKRRLQDSCLEPWNSETNEEPLQGEKGSQSSSKISSPFAIRESAKSGHYKGSFLTFFIPPSLERFYFHDNMYKMEIKRYQFNTTDGSRKLTHLFLQNNIFYKLTGPLIGFQGVQFLDLSNNLCTDISIHFFQEFYGLLNLNLSKNMLSTCIENDLEGKIFKRLKKLKVLDLSFNRIRNLPYSIFKNMEELTNLYIKSNSLETFSIAIDHMPNLSFIDLSNNRIAYFDASMQTSLQGITENQRIQINLMKNPLQCTCKTLTFIKWLQTYQAHILDFKRYNCISSNSSILKFHDSKRIISSLEYLCATYITLIVVETLLLIIFLSLTIAGILNRYKWRLRHLFYIAKRRHVEVQHLQTIKSDTYRYDAFVSYADEDKDFILQKLDFLEEKSNLRLCLHSRDFIPGTDIADNIVNAIHQSRRTLCVLSSHFFDSYWCMYELNMARMESIYSRKGSSILCLVVLNKTVFQNIPLKVVDLFENQTYVEYYEYENNDTPFWNKMCQILQS